MKKLLFFAESVSLAHIGRSLMLADWAKQNGYQTHIATGIKGVNLLQSCSHPHNFSEIFTITDQIFYQRVNQGKFFWNYKELVKYVSAEIQVIQQFQPDFIISDFRLTTAISARVMKIPLINLSNIYWCPNYECPFPAPHAGIFRWMPEYFRTNLFNFIRPLAFKNFGKPLNTIRQKHRLPKVEDFRTHYTAGDYTLYLDHPDFLRNVQLPYRHSYLGPVIWAPDVKEKINHDKRNSIYITMGSSGNNQLLTEITKACVKLGRNIIISGLNTSETKKLLSAVPGLNKKATIKPLINVEEILPNCSLTICHGGSGTVYQSLKAQTPVLCFPHNPDQGLVALAVKHGNWGSVVSPSQSNSSFIFDKIIALENDETIKSSVKRFSEKLNIHNTKINWLSFLANISESPIEYQIMEEIK